jgi:hypothetical protein
MRIIFHVGAVLIATSTQSASFAQSTSPLDALRALRGVLQNQNQVPNQQPVIPSRSPGFLPPVQRDVQQQDPPRKHISELNPGACQAIQADPIINRYVDSKETLRSMFESELQHPTGSQFSKDKLLNNWVSERLSENRIPRSELNAAIAKCAYEVKDTKYLWAFLQPGENYSNLRGKFGMYAPRKVKKLDANGQMIEVETDAGVNRPGFWESSAAGEILKSESIEISAWFFPNGQQAASTFISEAADRTVAVIDKINAEKREKEEISRRVTQAAEDKKKADIERKAAYAAQLKKDEAAKAPRLAAIKNGDLKVAQSCLEVGEALDATIDYRPTTQPAGYTYFVGTLREYDKGLGHIAGESRSMVEFVTNSNTHWISRDSIRVSSTVAVLGKYIGNKSIILNNNASMQVQNLQLLCIEPYTPSLIEMMLRPNR